MPWFTSYITFYYVKHRVHKTNGIDEIIATDTQD